jgi:hypothetical protein
MRTYKNIIYDADKDVIQNMHTLSEPNVSIERYRNAFYHLGRTLGEILNNKTTGRYGNTMLACASEDADWLAHGVLDALSQKNVSLAVFWNERITLDSKTHLEYSPIIKSYVELVDNCQTLIIVKSIISTSCVVKTQLSRLINSIDPQKIFIVAPVMYMNAEKNLRKEFPISVSDKFEFVTLAIDTEKDQNQNIIPGVGGMVYPKLGLGDSHDKNKYMPELVKSRIL